MAWSPFSGQIADTQADIATIDSALGSLESCRGSYEVVKSDLNNLEAHISCGFQVSAQGALSNATSPASEGLSISARTLWNARDALCESLESLRSQERWYFEEQERQRQRLLQQQIRERANSYSNYYSNPYSWRGW